MSPRTDSPQRRLRRRFWIGLWHVRQTIRRGLRLVGRALAVIARPVWTALQTALWACALAVAARLARRHRGGQRLWWGTDPLISLKYLSDAMRSAGFESNTVVHTDYEVYKATRFDLYYDDIVARSRLPGPIARPARDFVVFWHLIRNFDIAHIPFTGGPLGRTSLAALEPRLLRWAGVKTVMLPYGGDFWRYSWVLEALVRHAYLIDYPEPGRREDVVDRRVKRWMRHADVVFMTTSIEGASRWDVMAPDFNIVPLGRVTPRERWGDANGRSEPVTIVHAPNHRGVKGTEFILGAIDALERKGYSIDLVLLERRPNEEVLEAMRRADICIDHCVGSGWGLFSIEAMGSGATVIANLEDEQRLGVHRHFGWLNQSPIVSANIEQLEATIEYLIGRPELREELGRIGVEFVRRFHSPDTARYTFGSIYRSLAGEEVDLMRLFHPITSEYMRRFEPLRPPLHRNRPLELGQPVLPQP
jgi:glycosyltransferase involved in cell wall biosynthesis